MKLWNRWLAWLGLEETAEPLALFRIGCGLCVVTSLASVVASGLALPLWADAASGWIALCFYFCLWKPEELRALFSRAQLVDRQRGIEVSTTTTRGVQPAARTSCEAEAACESSSKPVR